MHNDLMLFSSLFFFFVIITLTFGQENTLYVKHGDIAELCDNRSTSIYAYEYRSFDGKKNLIVEPSKDDRYSNPYRTSLLRIKNVNEDDSGLYKCPQDDTEWQRLQIYSPVQHVYLSNLHVTSRTRTNDLCGMDNNNCLVMVEGEPLDIVCAADGSPRPAFDISFDKSGPAPTIMALAGSIQIPSVINNQFKPTVYEAYRIPELTPEDNGRNLTCRVDMKQINEKLILSSTKQVYIEFRPTVVEKSRKMYLGINQTRTINCTVIRANPTYIRYTINGLPSSIIHRTYSDPNQMYYSFDITPTSIEHFRSFNVTANNSIGYDTCSYELIHGGVPDAITQCTVETHTSNTTNATTAINCAKSYAQGDSDGYTCILFKYNDTDHHKTFIEEARTKSCIFALIPLREPAEFRVAAFNRFGSLPINTFGYVIHLNQPIVRTHKPFFNKKILVVIGSIFGGAILFFFLCCLCGTCHRDQTKPSNRNNFYQKDKYPRTSAESESLKPITDDTHLTLNGGDRHHQNGAVYDIPAHLNGKYSYHTSSPSSVYHQQKPQQSAHVHYMDQDSITNSLNTVPTRARTFNNKFYGNPLNDNKYGPISPTSTLISARKLTHDMDEHNEEEDDSPVYSTTTDVMSESGSFLVSSSSTKRRAPPPPKPRYSTLGSIRIPQENLDKNPMPLPKPRSRSNSRTRLNNGSSDNSSYLYEERLVSSSDSGIGQSDVVCLPNGDTIRSGLVKLRQSNLQKNSPNSPFFLPSAKYETLTSPVVRGTEC